ncbi:MAG: antitoxin MazE family protein [Proteobacteria bacterium]|nr:antitoxin MazE family protein [Pseudomonadota bacterium]MBS0551700.1 antitoxin MazE family protein [Pseudomonadota bacterium]
MATSVSERVGRYRTNLREAGLRPVQIWVPDTRRPGFADECRRQSSLLKGDPLERDVLDWIEQAADTDGWV